MPIAHCTAHLAEWAGLVRLFHADIKGGFFRNLFALKHPHRLVVFHHFYRSHRIDRHIARGLVVAVAQQVSAFDVEFVDGLSLIRHHSVVCNLYSW